VTRTPKLRDWLEEDWSRANLAIEEFLRFVSPVQFTKPRFVRQDIELGGVRLKTGDKIMAMLAAANMDPNANPHPEKLDLERRPNRHLSFGTRQPNEMLRFHQSRFSHVELMSSRPNTIASGVADPSRWGSC
jgi:cytochrome P450